MSPKSNRIALVAARWHAEIVDQAVSACRAGLTEHGFTDITVFSAVLTPHHFHEHGEHQAYFARHFEIKGAELANAIAATLNPEVVAV